ncbi:uncharacterized protein LOC129761310 [Toxorhynchites rutilus septentrionalis]|uniref:uncharacterized protein LOC129761310 n=1 Tax=Toxorhynchites rutilus septentrionalis TaxID=329112 RepID=UPI00247A53C3|nr:uncharacterized protein LOC129761310 [Toxorhynchites rutilus septentrionalis]
MKILKGCPMSHNGSEKRNKMERTGVVELPEEFRDQCEVTEKRSMVDGRRVVQQRHSQERRSNAISDFAPGQRSTPQTSRIPNPLTERVLVPPPATAPTEETICILNRSQLAARQAISKDLPEFAGNPEEWPLFFSMYASSTQMCDFSNEENMLRLRKCLKGKALEAVRCRLLHPSNVSGVLSTLKMLYGRPETIVQAAIRKIRSLPSPEIDRLETLVTFALTVENLVATIEACGVQDFVYNASLKFELVDRLPPTLRLDWAKYSRGNPAQNLTDFSSWLYCIAEDASAVMQTTTFTSRNRGNKKDAFINFHSETDVNWYGSPSVPTNEVHTHGRDTPNKCVACKGSCSSLTRCKRFVDLSYESKWAVIREAKLCRKCLRKHNGTCRQQGKCGVNGCSYLHHPLLHVEKIEVDRSFPHTDAATNTSCNVHQSQTNEVLFRIVPVVLYGPSKMVHTYAFIDDGSELTLIEHSLAKELGLQGSQKTFCLKWTGGTTRMENESHKVELAISPTRNTSRKYHLTSVRTIQELKLRPQTLIASDVQSRYTHLAGIPLESYTEVSPRILIGLDNARLGHAFKSREGKPFEPIAVKTRLGWIVYGNCSSKQLFWSHINYHAVQVCECNEGSDENLHAAMKTYFTLDSMGIFKPDKLHPSVDDQRATKILETVTFLKEGRFESGLLFKYDTVRLPDSKAMALKRWECLERRMKKDDVLAKTIREKMAEYVQKGRRIRDAKLATNSSAVLASVQEEVTNEKNLGFGEENATEKVLGLWWNTTADYFTFKVSPRYNQDLLSGHRRPTKREVLRTLMMMFDPLGFIANFLMYLKVLL